jgi:hypothetical protein
LAAGFLATGCSTTLQHGKINTNPMADKGSMGVTERAENMKDRIGWGTFTVFAIPVAPVTVNGEADKELMNQLKDAVEQAGYKATLVESANAAGGMPVLSCKVDKFSFRNYCWLFPLVLNWGTITLDTSVTAPDGKVLWHKTYTGKANGFYSFDSTVNEALTKVVNDLSSDLQQASFAITTNVPSSAAQTSVPINITVNQTVSQTGVSSGASQPANQASVSSSMTQTNAPSTASQPDAPSSTNQTEVPSSANQ